MIELNGSFYAFLIDTDTYAGSFEREMTAFCTGMVGECGVGQAEAISFKAEHGEEWGDKFDHAVSFQSDDRGCSRPTSIWPTNGWFNDGMGGHYRDDKWGTPEVAAKLQKKVDDYESKHPSSKLGHRLHKHPAYQSVAIFFHDQPDAEMIAFMKTRAEEYTSRPPKNEWDPEFKIEGYRLVRVRTVQEEILTKLG